MFRAFYDIDCSILDKGNFSPFRIMMKSMLSGITFYLAVERCSVRPALHPFTASAKEAEKSWRAALAKWNGTERNGTEQRIDCCRQRGIPGARRRSIIKSSHDDKACHKCWLKALLHLHITKLLLAPNVSRRLQAAILQFNLTRVLFLPVLFLPPAFSSSESFKVKKASISAAYSSCQVPIT